MENDKDETWERLKKPYLTIEQKKDIIQELNGKRFEEEWNKLLSEITELARENGIRIPTDEE